MSQLLQRLKQRKLVQWAVAYVAAAFALLQGIDIVASRFGWPAVIERGLILASCIGFFVVLVLAWYHGERGAQRVSGTELLILALLLSLGGAFLWRYTAVSQLKSASEPVASSSGRAIPAKSIAVLPFENLSSDKENAYFAEGIQDEILTRLAKIGALKVISRTSTQHYASSPDNLPEIAKQLGVANILEGSVQKAANAVHVNVQLIRAATDDHLWAESYNRQLDDIFGVEAEVAQSIASALNAQLTGAEQEALAQKPTSNPAAYDAYLRGVASLGNLALDAEKSLKAAVHSFQEAVRIDPQFALAWAKLCRAHSMIYFHYMDRSETRRTAAANALAAALRLQPHLPEAQLAKADFQYWVLLDYKGARDLLQQLHLSWPSNAEILQDLGWDLARLGDWEESAQYLDKAISLNPRDLYLRQSAVGGRLALRDFATALRMLDDAFQIWPDNVVFLDLKAQALQATGQLDQAQRIVDRLHPGPDRDGLNAIANQAKLRRAPALALPYFQALSEQTTVNLSDLPDLINFANLLELSGDKTKARAMFLKARDGAEAALKEQPDNALPITLRAYALAGLGERDAALNGIDQALALTVNDARNHGTVEEIKARILTRFGEKDRAIALLQHLVGISYDGPGEAPLTPALLRLDPDFDPLRGDPRFEILCREKQP
ncbi:MAG TPA: tetratricopeptide repeat protein [Chthoniobacterales bacterium]|nr:tetratricopeptide repeat protein [Chthoniobacterales bacterium]